VAVTETTANLSEALTAQPTIALTGASPAAGDVITVDDAQPGQTVTGFGATFTDSSAWLVQDKLSATARAALMRRLFGADGIRLTVLRQPMGATDFIINGPGSYFTYDDTPGLEHFSIGHDTAYVLPVLRQALAADPKILVMLAAWTAPAWMKSNHSLVNGGSLDSRYYGIWAKYYAKTVAAYTAAGVPIWAVSAQNEPSVSSGYPSMTWTAAQQAQFITQDLRPALAAAGYSPGILAADSVCFDAAYAAAVLDDPAHPVRTVASGVSEHGYCGTPDQLTKIHDRFPDLGVYQTELSPGCQPQPTIDAEIRALRNWAKTVVTWNVALDGHGGPYHTGGASTCVGLVTVDPATGAVRYNLPYYQEGQLSGYVDRGAVRVASSQPAGLFDVAFKNPDGRHVLAVHNTGKRPRTFTVRCSARSFRTTLAPDATATYRWS
jgi:glucosylceramidase